MNYKKKLIEEAIPLQAINDACVKEKAIKHGHPSTLHPYWARRPLAAVRAIIFSSIVDSPFEDSSLSKKEKEKKKDYLFSLIKEMVNWDNFDNPMLLNKIMDVYKNNNSKIPPVLDPFCGGGTIPLEAQKLGLDAYGSDLNPLAVLITKSLIELPKNCFNNNPVNPEKTNFHSGMSGLIEDIVYYSTKINNSVKNKVNNHYPKSENGEVIIAWIWTRIVKCPNPMCKVHAPLVRTFDLHKMKDGKWIIIPIVKGKNIEFKVEKVEISLESGGTVNRNGAKCLSCSSPIPFDYIRNEGKLKKINYQMMAYITENGRNRNYYKANDFQVKKSEVELDFSYPDTLLPEKALGFRVQAYGYHKHYELFTNRQLLTITSFATEIKRIKNIIIQDGGKPSYADAIITYITLAFSSRINYWSTFTPWGGSYMVNTFSRQALPMVWDFAEANPFSNSSGNFLGGVKFLTKVLSRLNPNAIGKSKQIDVSKSIMDLNKPLIITDPPYYDNIGYADLSDYFYVWIREVLGDIYPELFNTILTPKSNEIIATPFRFGGSRKKANEHFLNGLSNAANLISKKSNEDYPVIYFYSYKQTENSGSNIESSTGWEVFLEGLINAGHQITATWPVRTEQVGGMKYKVNALATSVVIALRKKNKNARIATRKEFVDFLKNELESSILTMMDSDISPVDLQQSAIGPGMAVFTRFAKVLEADGTSMTVKTALQIINAELDRIQESSEIDMDPDTRFCIQWFDSFGIDEKPFGEAETLAKAKDISVDGLVNAGVFIAGGGKAKLKHWTEMPSDWDPRTDNRLTLWECTHHLVRELIEGDGQIGAAKLAKFMGNQKAEEAKELAYQLFHICDKRKWAKHAGDYNTLVANWADIKSQIPNVSEGQETLF